MTHSPQPNPEAFQPRNYAAELGLVDGKFVVPRSGREADTEGWTIDEMHTTVDDKGERHVTVDLVNLNEDAAKEGVALEKFLSWQPVEEDPADITIPNDKLQVLRQEALEDAHEQLAEAPMIVKDTGEVALDGVVENPDHSEAETAAEVQEEKELPEVNEARSEYLRGEVDRLALQVTQLEAQIGSIDRLAEKLQQDAIANGGTAKKQLVRTLEDYSRSSDDLIRRVSSGDYPLDSLVTLSNQFARDSHGINSRFRGLSSSLQDSMATDVRRYKSAVGDMYEKVARAGSELNKAGSEIIATDKELSNDAELVDKINDTIQKIITMKGDLEAKKDSLSVAKLLDAAGFDQRTTDELQSQVLSYLRDAEQLPDVTRRHGVEGTVMHATTMKRKLQGVIAAAQASTR